MTSDHGTDFDVFATRAIQIVATSLAAIAAVQADFWWLLRAGHDIWHTGGVPLTDHYSYTASGRSWPNHEWLWEAAVFALHHVGGMPLVATAVAATAGTTIWLLPRLTKASGYVVPAVLLLVVPLLSVSWTMRPQVTSSLLFAVTMLLLTRERYWLLPPLFLLWANVHAQVVAGGVLLAAATFLALARWLVTRTAQDRARVARLATVTTVAAGATLLTPLGFGLWSYVADANGRPGEHAISEWHSAFEVNALTLWFWPVAAIAAGAMVLRRGRLREWQDQVGVAAVAGAAPLAVLAVRNIPFFAVAVAPLLMTLLAFQLPRQPGTVEHARAKLTGSALAAAVAVVTVWTLAPSALGWNPVPAPLAEAVRRCPGHLFNGYQVGSALIWWVPEVKVFVDNRQDPYPPRVIDTLFEIRGSNYRRIFGHFGVRCALLDDTDPMTRTLSRDGWMAVYADDEVSLWTAPRATSATE